MEVGFRGGALLAEECLDSSRGWLWVLGQEDNLYTDGATLRFRQQVGKSAQGLSAGPGWGLGGRPQSGNGKRCGKERGTSQNFRVVFKFKHLPESLGGLLKCSCLSPTPQSLWFS